MATLRVILSVSSPNPSVDVFQGLRSFFDFSVNHPGVLLHSDIQVGPTFTVEDSASCS